MDLRILIFILLINVCYGKQANSTDFSDTRLNSHSCKNLQMNLTSEMSLFPKIIISENRISEQ